MSTGGFVWLPRDVSHTFRVDSAEAEFLEFATPGGVEGFHLEVSDIADALTVPPAVEPDIARMVGAVPTYGIEIVGPPLA